MFKKLFKRQCCQIDKTTPFKNEITVGLLGNPNCGKTTVFNALTGACQRVGNWPGVTVQRMSGALVQDQQKIDIIDLPGTYALNVVSLTSSVDERIACEFIANREADVILNIIDANNLERNLYLTMQLLEMHVPVVVAVNMLDVAKARGIHIDLKQLQNKLQCPVIGLEAHKNIGIDTLKEVLFQQKKLAPTMPSYDPSIQDMVSELAKQIECVNQTFDPNWLAIRLLENDVYVEKLVSEQSVQAAKITQQKMLEKIGEDADIILADQRYQAIEKIVKQITTRHESNKTSFTKKLDKILLNRLLGLPLFLTMMYALFFFAINIGGAFQDFFDLSSQVIFVDSTETLLQWLHAPNWLIALLAHGVGKGLNTTITFIPVIAAMFFFLALLEDSGYMARAAFVVDRLMRALGLPGKAFVPMIVGFGCNVPAVMAARTLENQRDRILTVMMSPFMSCSARLAIFAVFTAAFFPAGGQNIIFLLYLIGILMAVFTGFALRKTVLKGKPAPLVMELPPYHFPRLNIVIFQAWQRLKGFVFRAGKLIVPICLLLGMLNTLNIDGTLNVDDANSQTILSSIGKTLTPIFAPMGIESDNWPATVGLLTGVLAKEVVVGTLNALYSQSAHLTEIATVKAALLSIPENFKGLGAALQHPLLSKAPIHSLPKEVYGTMYQQFNGTLAAFAYLLFVLLYFPCVSTIAVMARELNWRWAAASVGWSTAIAYGTAVGFYQIALFAEHPVPSLLWMVGIISALFLMLGFAKPLMEGAR